MNLASSPLGVGGGAVHRYSSFFPKGVTPAPFNVRGGGIMSEYPNVRSDRAKARSHRTLLPVTGASAAISALKAAGAPTSATRTSAHSTPRANARAGGNENNVAIGDSYNRGAKPDIEDLIRLFRNNASIFRKIHLPQRGRQKDGEAVLVERRSAESANFQ